MSANVPHVYGNINVTWNVDGSVNQITYSNHPLIDEINARLQLQLTPQGVILLPTSFRDLVLELLDSIASLHLIRGASKVYLADAIFSNLSMNTTLPNPKLQNAILKQIIDLVWNWENVHEKVHKGTPYYFLAENCLSQGDIPSAYIYFFNAIEQDRLNHPAIGGTTETAPAFMTTSLIDNVNNRLYYQVVVPLRNYLQTFIQGYNSRTNSNLTIQTVDQKFLQVDRLADIKRFFVANFHEVFHLRPLNTTSMINNDYSKLKIIDTLFNMSLIVDQILEKRFLAGVSREDKKMANAVYQLALYLNWTNVTIDRNTHEFLQQIRPNLNSGSPDRILPYLLNNRATLHNGAIDAKMKAVFLTYHLRNFAGHNIEQQTILVNRYSEILEGVMDSLLAAIEVL